MSKSVILYFLILLISPPLISYEIKASIDNVKVDTDSAISYTLKYEEKADRFILNTETKEIKQVNENRSYNRVLINGRAFNTSKYLDPITLAKDFNNIIFIESSDGDYAVIYGEETEDKVMPYYYLLEYNRGSIKELDLNIDLTSISWDGSYENIYLCGIPRETDENMEALPEYGIYRYNIKNSSIDLIKKCSLFNARLFPDFYLERGIDGISVYSYDNKRLFYYKYYFSGYHGFPAYMNPDEFKDFDTNELIYEEYFLDSRSFRFNFDIDDVIHYDRTTNKLYFVSLDSNYTENIYSLTHDFVREDLTNHKQIIQPDN